MTERKLQNSFFSRTNYLVTFKCRIFIVLLLFADNLIFCALFDKLNSTLHAKILIMNFVELGKFSNLDTLREKV